MGALMLVVLIFILISFPFVLERKRIEKEREQYYQTEYAVQTQNSYEQVVGNEGLLGEYFIYKTLETLDGPRKFLFNLYLPTWDGGTTELDAVLLHESGIYVFESKNYGGWIFGSETQQYWTQTLPARQGRLQRYRFYNPIFQNSGHLDRLYQILRPVHLLSGPPHYYSYIVFGNRCVFKDVPRKSGNHYVLYLNELFYAVQENAAKSGTRLTATDIAALHEELEPYTCTDDAVKQAHIDYIRLTYR